MKKLILLSILYMLIPVGSAKADVTANFLLLVCNGGEETKTKAYCVGYVTGYMSSLSVSAHRDRTNFKIQPDYNLYFDLMKPCLPGGTTVRNIINLIKNRFPKLKPEKLKLSAALVLLEVLHDRFPCDEGI